jgi:uncharacterized protein
VISRRSIIIGVLILLPVLMYVILGGFALWQTGLFRWVWWLAPACWVLAWSLSRFWRPADQAAQPSALSIPSYWTPRDHEAAAIVREFQKKVEKLTPVQFTDLQYYQTEVHALAVVLARHYHPQATDPLSSLTVPEILAAARLAVDDMEQWMLTSVPGSRLLTIKQWRSLQSAPKWIRRLQNAAWAASILMNPMNIAQFLVSKLTVDPLTNALQTEFLSALYLRFFQFVGFYLIEMNSGRLRGGADAYRRAFPTWAAGWAGGAPGHSAAESASAIVAAQPLTVALVGQVSSGKSSLINALTGSHQAAVDILPETRAVARYQMVLGEPSVAVTLLDTPGYGEIGATADQMQQIQAALKESNAVLLVMDAHSPAREADRRTIRDLEAWYLTQPRLKPPPMLGVLTHVDLLRPTLEWSPPYEWREPSRPKEQSIHDAVGYARELFAGSLAGVAPVCTDARPERAWGILEEVLPALTLIVSDAQSAALLRAFEHELDRERLKTLLRQVQRCGSELLRCWIEERLRPPAGDGEA